jgi:phosphoglycolate phosphatase
LEYPSVRAPLDVDVLVFDFDGTLIDSDGLKRDTYFRVGAEFCINRITVQSALVEGGDRFEVFRRLAASANRPDCAETMVNAYTRYLEQGIPKRRSAPGIPETLKELKRNGISLFLNSATPRKELMRIVAALGWADEFEDILGRPESKSDNLRQIVASIRCDTDRLVVIGNGHDDAAAAEEIGCRFFWADPFAAASEPLPACAVETVVDFATLIP